PPPPAIRWTLLFALPLLLDPCPLGAVGETRYEKFLRQHVDHPRTSVLAAHRYCETMLARRRVTAPGRPCKPSNTFVHAPAEELLAACTQTPDAAGLRSTPTPMGLTHHVRVACLDGLPVWGCGFSLPLGAP
uniref:Ribonuclease A-domain domain-containing protein n=1 Tax=Aquila chrysaetos chrysaetos TaxID=223781 RepID=A0A663DZS3_AQUCH